VVVGSKGKEEQMSKQRDVGSTADLPPATTLSNVAQ